jgi:hypothetical protein
MSKLGTVREACDILKDDADFFTGDIRKCTAWERFEHALQADDEMAKGEK